MDHEIEIPKWLKKFASLNDSPLYIVGGYIRNALSGLPPSDIDVAGKPLPETLRLPRGFYFATTYKRMGTALIRHRFNDKAEVEYTPFRTEEYAPGGGHVPVKVEFDADISEDAKRRDFTVNSLYMDIGTGKIYDFFDGLRDIERRVMRAYDPVAVFSSDGLRLMRLIRIAAETGFGVDSATADAAMRNAHLLADVTPNRKRDELLKMLHADEAYGVEDAHYRALTMLRDYGMLKYVIPELAELDGLAQNAAYHKYDALEHTFRVVRYSPPQVRLAALLHDVGKAECVRRNGNMHDHNVLGAEMAERILTDLKFPRKDVEHAVRLVRYHMYDKDRMTGDGKMLLFVAENADIVDDLTELMEADTLGKGVPTTTPAPRLRAFLKRFHDSGAPRRPGEMKINGADLAAMGYSGDAISAELSELYRTCVLEPSVNDHKRLTAIARKHIGLPEEAPTSRRRRRRRRKKSEKA